MNYDFLTWLSLEMSDLMLSALSTLAIPSPPLLLSVSYLRWQTECGWNFWVKTFGFAIETYHVRVGDVSLCQRVSSEFSIFSFFPSAKYA